MREYVIYHNADLTFSHRERDGTGVVVAARASGGNEAKEVVLLPQKLADFDPRTSFSRSGGERRATIESEAFPDVESVGEALFDALFVGELRRFFDKVNTQAISDGAGLRLRLHFDLGDIELRSVASYPWELIRDPGARQFLALSAKTPIVRYVEAGQPYSRGDLTEGLKVLVVMANVVGHTQLDLEEERRRIERNWAGQAGVEVEYLGHESSQPATPAALQSMVHGVHVLHFMGHGDPTGRALLLSNDSGEPQLLRAERFAQWLAEDSLRLVVLNACDAGRMDQQEPFSGFASRLVAAGVPAVVAMQRPISDAAAVAFAGEFYGHLARGLTVDEAVAAGRRAIDARNEGMLEWVTPVLFMRADDGVLFDRVESDSPMNVASVADGKFVTGERTALWARRLATYASGAFAFSTWQMNLSEGLLPAEAIWGFLMAFTGILAVGGGAFLAIRLRRSIGLGLFFGVFVVLVLPLSLLFDRALLVPVWVGLAALAAGLLVSRRGM